MIPEQKQQNSAPTIAPVLLPKEKSSIKNIFFLLSIAFEIFGLIGLGLVIAFQFILFVGFGEMYVPLNEVLHVNTGSLLGVYIIRSTIWLELALFPITIITLIGALRIYKRTRRRPFGIILIPIMFNYAL